LAIALKHVLRRLGRNGVLTRPETEAALDAALDDLKEHTPNLIGNAAADAPRGGGLFFCHSLPDRIEAQTKSPPVARRVISR
jgi:hypothetical protein